MALEKEVKYLLSVDSIRELIESCRTEADIATIRRAVTSTTVRPQLLLLVQSSHQRG